MKNKKKLKGKEMKEEIIALYLMLKKKRLLYLKKNG